ncbi:MULTISPECIES: hypothetical protein [unclassified Crossiella]|uniref:hypothetical protein n=1 Tax=unclassified Crossiella TaxID=2620835 RepID=UPI001FFFD989|nr:MULTISPECIES: hypothetical protein [unclassified Crossiella]MCK2244498.1 hypothetical protein [Crossiella sp. S99.2]MCK2258129.1 hypothetical protein [Crossiella sp. S99.1]
MTEDNLRDRLRRADPAAGLRPLPPDQTRRLLTEASTAVLDVPAPRPPFLRRPLVLIGAGALVATTVVVVALTSGGSGGGEPGPGPVIALPTSTGQPGPGTGTFPGTFPGAPSSSAAQPNPTGRPPSGTPHTTSPPPATTSPTPGGKITVNVLTDRADPGGRCPKPEAQHLAATAGLAFEGTVLRVVDNLVTLQVKRTWTGAETDLAEVRNADAASSAILAGLAPEPGQTYLVAAADRQVMGCGYSGPADAELRALYDQAFPRR